MHFGNYSSASMLGNCNNHAINTNLGTQEAGALFGLGRAIAGKVTLATTFETPQSRFLKIFIKVPARRGKRPDTPRESTCQQASMHLTATNSIAAPSLSRLDANISLIRP
jgi:hypothetical protein